MKKFVPFLTPIWRISEICATNDGTIDTKVPEENPNMAAKIIVGTLP